MDLELPVRASARLVLLNENDRVLLLRFEDVSAVDPTKPNLLSYWVTPGGGVEEGETYESTAQRELWEETGIVEVSIGSWIWTRERKLHISGKAVLSHERYFYARTTTSKIDTSNLLPNERQVYREHHWWSLKEMTSSDEVFLPAGLTVLLAPIIAGDLPLNPLAIEVA